VHLFQSPLDKPLAQAVTPAHEGLRQVRSGEVDVAIVDDWRSRLAAEIETGGSILTCYHLVRDELVLVVLSEFEGVFTIVSLVARGIGIAIMPRMAVTAAGRGVAVRDLPQGLDLARDIYAVARTASVRRPSVAVIVTALRAAAKAMPAPSRLAG
jgi:DNA-binding transcriptional LysR family regulator